ncbi:MipA/OmpV family protein [Colwellia psychrerythraea]|uniref:MltA-interacting MipA family protein n=1 Tax=Colwellia psychrerythraea TaxID=28229 RepID=A0A099KEK8_COLPS|nr:MipA/OmpV family protein [Colwellia psychrerythraea]KGJ89179.1 MltA-interacting MipA family protein [Colwellia psychrerythraea]
MRYSRVIALTLTLLISINIYAESISIERTPSSSNKVPTVNSSNKNKIFAEQTWGLGVLVRNAEIPFDTEADNVTSFVPMMFYQGDTFFIRGIEGGAHLYQNNDWQFNAMARMRFFDIPAEYQNEVQGDTIDLGFQARKAFSKGNFLDFELFSDLEGNPYANLSQSWHFQHNSWEFMPKVSARYKSASFNSHYYALADIPKLNGQRIGAGIEVTAGVETRYHVASNFYLLASVNGTLLDNNAYNSTAVSQRWQSEAYLGFAFFNDISKAKKSDLTNHGYLRLAHGWATPSNIGDILAGDTVKDEYNNQLSSIFYGLPLTDELFSLPLEIFLTPGFVWHWNSEVQDSGQEYVLAIKAYYTINWPVRWRLGLAEGLSYASNVTYIEASEMERKGYRPSELMNYIDFTVDINLGDIFNVNALNETWLGYSIHHRSAIFESASQFGRIKGGSNYNTVYIQFDF